MPNIDEAIFKANDLLTAFSLFPEDTDTYISFQGKPAVFACHETDVSMGDSAQGNSCDAGMMLEKESCIYQNKYHNLCASFL